MQGFGIYVKFELLCTPFVHAIAGSYKNGAAHHCNSEMYVYSLCNRSLSTQGSLKRHRESVHYHSAGFSCQVCSKRVYRKDHLGRHMKMHRPAVEVRRNLLASPRPPPKKQGEAPVCDVCAKSLACKKH